MSNYKLVPEVPTEEMIEAALNCPIARQERDYLQDCYAAMLAAAPAADGGWLPMDSFPHDGGTYLVMNSKGEVAPHIRGIIHNNIGTANDWHYGEAVTGWQPLPAPAKAKGETP
jgi:hypothetical protein